MRTYVIKRILLMIPTLFGISLVLWLIVTAAPGDPGGQVFGEALETGSSDAGESRRIFIGDQPVNMGPTEFNLLQFFMSHPERAYSRGQLLDQVWGANVYVEERTVDVHIRRLRKALQLPQADYSDLIQTVRGTGYRFSSRGLSS